MTEEQVDNLKEDFIWFRPGVNKLSVMECTCGHFLESAMSTDAGMDFLAKAAARHARKTGHALNPRGN